MEIVFTLFLVTGVGYLLLIIFGGIGEAFQLDGVDSALESSGLGWAFGLDFDAESGAGDATGIGCSVLAAFMAGFGVVGLVGSSAGWNSIVVLIIAAIGGYLLGRGFAFIMRYVLAGQSSESFFVESLIGKSARVTINSDAGRTGEVIIQEGQTRKFPVKEMNDAPLKRGDIVEIVDVVGQVLHVKRKNA